MTTATINRKIAERRPLTFRTMQDIAADVEAMGPDDSALRVTGNWTAAQVLGHVTFFIEGSLDGLDIGVPFHFKLLGKLLKKGATTKPLKPGFNMPAAMAKAATPPADLSWIDAVAAFRAAMTRLDGGERMTKSSPVFGPMTHEEWEGLHCRHAEMHFGFIHPPGEG